MWTNQPLQAIQHIRVLGHASHTHLMLCAQNFLCVVKIPATPNPRLLMTSFLATRLARHAGLPTPESVVVEISQFLARTTPELTQAATLGARAFPGLHPATYCAGNPSGQRLLAWLPEDGLASICNRSSFSHFLAFSQWCTRFGSPTTLFYRPSNSSHHTVEFLNWDAAFSGPSLRFHDHPRNGVYDSRAVYRHVTGWESFEPFLTNLILTSPDSLWQLTRNLPFGWSEEFSRDLDALVDSLLRRRSLIRQLIARSRDQIPDLFPNWTRRAFMPAQASWFEAPRGTGMHNASPIHNSVQTY